MINSSEPYYGSVANDGYEIIGGVTNYVSTTGASIFEATKTKFSELKAKAEHGDWTMRLAGCIAGGMILVLSVMSFMSDLLGLAPFNAILDVYLSLFGLLTLLLEYKEAVFPATWLHFIKYEAHFLYQPYGRAAFYFFMGIVFVVRGGLLSSLCGLYTIAVGGWLFISWRKANQALQELRQQRLSDVDVVVKFNEFDKNKDGKLDMLEIRSLCASLGHTLTPAELESAFFILDRRGEGEVTLADFQMWYAHQQQV